MPPIDPLAIIFDQVSLLTNGLIKDMTTLILGILTVSFVLIGLDLLLTILQNPVANFQRGKAAVDSAVFNYRKSRLEERPFSSPSRSDVEISPLRQRDLDPLGSLESVDSTFSNNHWENDGVTLSDDRFAELESAMDEAVYNERMSHRLSDDEADDLVHSHGDRLRDSL
ncbi:MAG: hypothetical protein AB7U29_18345 [Desulfobulbus sp.]